MALPATGAISLSAIQTEFGGTNPIPLGDYYGRTINLPKTGNPIDFNTFHGGAKAGNSILAYPTSSAGSSFTNSTNTLGAPNSTFGTGTIAVSTYSPVATVSVFSGFLIPYNTVFSTIECQITAKVVGVASIYSITFLVNGVTQFTKTSIGQSLTTTNTLYTISGNFAYWGNTNNTNVQNAFTNLRDNTNSAIVNIQFNGTNGSIVSLDAVGIRAYWTG